MSPKNLILSILIFFALSAQGQKKTLLIEGEKGLVKYKSLHPDSLSADRELRKVFYNLHEQSYLAAVVDSTISIKDTLKVFISPGEKYSWAILRRGNVEEGMLDKDFEARFFKRKGFNSSKYIQLETKLLDFCDAHGYPFAAVGLDSVEISGNKVSASLKYIPGPKIVFDTIRIHGKTKIKSKYLAKHLKIIKGQPFSQKRINEINLKIKELGFLEQIREPVVIFNDGKAYVNLFLEERRLNQVDGIIGFLPNESKNKKLLVTGELNLNLKNLLGTGKNIGVEWKKFSQGSQFLNLVYFHPKLLSSNLDLRLNFDLLKQDTTFMNVFRGLVLSHPLSDKGRISFSAGIKTSRQLTEIQTVQNRLLLSDYNQYTYGLGYTYTDLDDPFYPRSGWQLDLKGFVGDKKIRKNETLDENLYKDVDLRSIQYSFNLGLSKYLRLGKNGVILGRAEGGKIFNDNNNIFLNDLYRVGGLKSLRGFNENYFFASTYGIATVEYRIFTDETSYLFLFYDHAYVENQLNTEWKSDYPYGLGAGVSFTTPAGIFNFVYSLGNSKDQKLSLNLSKIHFGIISRF